MAALISTPEGYATWVKLHELIGDPLPAEIANAKPAAPARRREVDFYASERNAEVQS